ncbi:MAG: hypothetical protein WA463_16575 [Terriglobales bacterium]
MAKLLAWALRVALLLLTPLFLLCAGVARMMMQLDAWTVDQLAAEPAMAPGKPQLLRPETVRELTGTERGGG